MIHRIARLMVLEHSLRAPGIAADVLAALAGPEDAEARETWILVCRAIWRMLHHRAQARIAA